MKKILHLILLFLFIGNIGFAQTLLLQESFEGDATNYDANTFTDGVSAYFTVFNISSPPADWPRAFSNVNGTYMFGAEDMDDVDNPLAPGDVNGYIVISSQNIAAYDQVQVILALGAVYDGGSDVSFEELDPDGIFVQYAFDGNIATPGDANVNTGTYTTVGQFKGNDGVNSTALYEDTNLDGTGDGTMLTETFQDFSYTINTNGATNVSIRIVIENDLSEEIGVDNIRVYGILTTSAPTVTINSASSISASSATMGGNVTSNGGAIVTERGVVYSTTDATPTIAEGATKDANGTGTGTFSESIGSLSANTTYYYNAYAINSEGTSYGTASSFTTLMNPPGNSLNFDGVDSKVSTTNILSTGTTSHTFEVWVKVPIIGTDNLISGERVGIIFGNFDFANPAVNYEIHDDGQVRWYIGGVSLYGTQDLRDNTWHHLSFIRDKTADKLYIYIDGELEIESASAGADQAYAKSQVIGMDQRTSGETPYFHGKMDELRIWNDVRTIEEIRANMKVALIGDEADLATYYKFDHASGSSLSDLTSNNNDGTLKNMVDADWVSSESMLYTPTASTETDLSANSFTANWEQNHTAAKYYLDVSTASDFSSFVTNYENKEIIGQSTVSQSVTGLTAGVNYYYRLRAYNENTLLTSSNSNIISFTTDVVASTVTTQAVTSIASTTATGNGNITDLGAPNPTAHGVCWNTGGTPTTSDDKTDEGAASSTGAFTSSLSSLSANTTYYVRAYATNSAGTSYGTASSFTTLKQSQTITFGSLSTKTYGDADFDPGATASSGLTVSYSSSNTSVATIVSGEIHIVGAGSCTIYADQAGNTTYYAASQESQSLTINKATPTVSAWPTAAGITYGDDLSSATLSGGEASVAGSFAYDDDTITPNAGTYSAALTFTPTDGTNYNTVAGNIDVTVAKATPTVTAWPTATGITYGDDLSSATLSGGEASVAGSFAYDDDTITPDAGTYSAALTFTPTDGTNYNTVAGNIDVSVNKASIVTTQAVTSIASTTATGNGNITDLGAPNPTAHGVCWNTGGTPTTADDKTDEGAASSTGAFTSSLTSLSPNTTYYVRAYATNSEGTSYGSEVSFTTDYGSTTWSGAIDTEWTTAGNWSDGVPTSGHDVTIPSSLTYYPIVGVGTDANCNFLEIEEGASLTVSGAGTLTASSDVLIRSDVSLSGSLIGNILDGSAANKTIIYDRYVADAEWHLLSAPVVGQAISSLLTNSDNSIELSGSDYSMKDYDEDGDSWNLPFTSATAGNMTSGKAYAIMRSTEGSISMEGEIASSPVTSTLTRTGQGWNLLGNPFPSAIAANTTADATNNLLTVNESVLDLSYTALYVWDYSTASYLIVNHVAGSPSATLAQDYLQAGQGFFVRSRAGGESFSITSAMQSHQTGVAFKSESEVWPFIDLKARTETDEANTRIVYHSSMKKGLDAGYDGGLFSSNSEFALYSRLVDDNGIDFMLQALPEDYDNLIIPIGLDAKAGEIVTFTAKTLNIPEAYLVVLEDRAMNTFTNLSEEGSEYAVQLNNDSDGTGRFFIRTSAESTLGLDDLEMENTYNVFSRVKDNQLIIRGEVDTNTTASIYSITGELMDVVNLKHATENSVWFNAEVGVYIIQIINKQGTYTQKFSWVK